MNLLAYIMINEGRCFKDGWRTMECSDSQLPSQSLQPGRNSMAHYMQPPLSASKGASLSPARNVQVLITTPHSVPCQIRDPAIDLYHQVLSKSKKGVGAQKKYTNICYAWNDGKCTRGNSCKYHHYVWLKCGEEHKAIHCNKYTKKWVLMLSLQSKLQLLPIEYHWWFMQTIILL